MAAPVRLGVIGLGRSWHRRFRPALARLSGLCNIHALCDEVARRAQREARKLGCAAIAGPVALLEHKEIDAILLADTQWFGLWPLGLTCRANKPVFCALDFGSDLEYAAGVYRRIKDSNLPVVMDNIANTAPASLRLQELLHGDLGPARSIVCELVEPAPVRPLRTTNLPGHPSLLIGRYGTSILDWCTRILEAQPVAVTSAGSVSGNLTGVFLEFGLDRAAQIIYRQVPKARTCFRLEVTAENGQAKVYLPNRVYWTDHNGEHRHILPMQHSMESSLLAGFFETIQLGNNPEPNFQDSYRVLNCLLAVELSRQQQRRIEITSDAERSQ